MSRIHHIYIDYENVQEFDLEQVMGSAVQVAVILGQQHKSVPLPLVRVIQGFPGRVRLIETVLNGKNALDFVLACQVGADAQRDPKGFFHIISRDKGFDALIRHLQSRDISAARHNSFYDLPWVRKPAPAKNDPPLPPSKPAAKPKPETKPRPRVAGVHALASRVMDHLSKATTSARPRTSAKLLSYVIAQLGNQVSNEQASAIVEALRKRDRIAINEKGAVTYNLETREKASPNQDEFCL